MVEYDVIAARWLPAGGHVSPPDEVICRDLHLDMESLDVLGGLQNHAVVKHYLSDKQLTHTCMSLSG